eukprot:4812055-Amphidinium_carterae.1
MALPQTPPCFELELGVRNSLELWEGHRIQRGSISCDARVEYIILDCVAINLSHAKQPACLVTPKP